jgi:hypothetical protein
MGKLEVIEQLGETGLLLPELINRGLAANDRLKYYLTLLQAAATMPIGQSSRCRLSAPSVKRAGSSRRRSTM